jgi:hypothetical protein
LTALLYARDGNLIYIRSGEKIYARLTIGVAVQKVEYWSIMERIKSRLDVQCASLSPVPVVKIEQSFKGEESYIGIFVESRSSPREMQQLRAGKATSFLVQFNIICAR